MYEKLGLSCKEDSAGDAVAIGRNDGIGIAILFPLTKELKDEERKAKIAKKYFI